MKKSDKQLLSTKNRVDFQVSAIVGAVILLSFSCIYVFNYFVTHSDMIHTLQERADHIYQFVEKHLDAETFRSCNTKEDMETENYKELKQMLEQIREITGVRYLYTAKRNQEGVLIYAVDGLPDGSEDFRFPGDPIETEIIPDLERALKNVIVYPKDILDTGWGYVFVCYYPIHDGNEVIGVLGMEFEALRQYNVFKTMRWGTPIIALVFTFAAVIVSIMLFNRISNPNRKDFAQLDILTGFQNRNAFEVYMNNQSNKKTIQNLCVFVADLNGLKAVNDNYGHSAGDEYIRKAGKVLQKVFVEGSLHFRTGGDEFVIITGKKDERQIQQYLELVEKYCKEESEKAGREFSMSIGFADSEQDDEQIYNIYNRADQDMYEKKRNYKKKKHGILSISPEA